MDYWEECIEEAFDDAGITATKEQINTVASWIESAHENFGMAHGHDCIPNPLLAEIDGIKKSHDKITKYNDKINEDREKELKDIIRSKNTYICDLQTQLTELRD